MEIHLISSLTSDDESRLAPKMLAAIGQVLDTLPVAYFIRIETASGARVRRREARSPRTGPVVSAQCRPRSPGRRDDPSHGAPAAGRQADRRDCGAGLAAATAT